MPYLQDARRTLLEVFGFERFREGQERVISALLEGRSSLAIFPTGGGSAGGVSVEGSAGAGVGAFSASSGSCSSGKPMSVSFGRCALSVVFSHSSI